MRVFSKHFIEIGERKLNPVENLSALNVPSNDDEIVCDEEVIERSLRLSGFEE